MLVSVFTPSHDPAGLRALWESLRAQTYTNWKWVVVPNGERAEQIVSMCRSFNDQACPPRSEGPYDARYYPIRCFEPKPTISGIGALKRFACERCPGDLFVEVDHDDVITPDCIESLVDAVHGRDSAFVYSDCVTTRGERDDIYDTGYGWRHYKAEVFDRHHVVNSTPPATARSLCDILYAPDHVRAWTRTAYDKSGGHDPAFEVGDDHELITRTYLAGADFVHVPRPLYLHQLSDSTASQTNLSRIRDVSNRTRDRYCHDLVHEWCRREELPMYDLGGAHDCPKDYTPIDNHLPIGHAGRGDVFDVVNAMPDDSVGCFRAFDFLEHVPTVRVVELMNLLYRKLVPGGWLLTHTPAVCDDEGKCGRGAYQAPDHVSFWSTNNFLYFTNRNYSRYVPEIKCRFQAVRLGNWYPSPWHRTNLVPYSIADLVALKNDDTIYFPGPRSI